MPVPVQDKSDETPYFPRFLMLIDRKNRIVLDQKLLDKKVEYKDAVVHALINYINQDGKPGKLLVRDRYFAHCVNSLCS